MTSSKTNEEAAMSSAASMSAAPHPRPRDKMASPFSRRNASTAWGRTSLPSSTMASRSLRTDSPGNTPAPNLVSQPAHKSEGRTAARRKLASSAGISTATARSSAAHSARKGRPPVVNAHGATSSTKDASIQNAFSSSSDSISKMPATVAMAGTYPCGDLTAVATKMRSSASRRQ